MGRVRTDFVFVDDFGVSLLDICSQLHVLTQEFLLIQQGAKGFRLLWKQSTSEEAESLSVSGPFCPNFGSQGPHLGQFMEQR